MNQLEIDCMYFYAHKSSNFPTGKVPRKKSKKSVSNLLLRGVLTFYGVCLLMPGIVRTPQNNPA